MTALLCIGLVCFVGGLIALIRAFFAEGRMLRFIIAGMVAWVGMILTAISIIMFLIQFAKS